MQIHIDAKNGNVQGVSEALDKGVSIESIEEESKLTPLMIALSSENAGIDMVRFLINNGANVNLPIKLPGGEFHVYPLTLAAQSRNLEKIKLLLKNGADPGCLKWSKLMFAVVFGTLTEMKSCLIQKSDLYDRDSRDRTPFLLSVQTGDIHKAEFLLSSGSNRKDTGRRGKTPYMYAVENDDLEMMTWLARNQFDVNETDSFQTTPLMAAAENNSVESTKHLLTLGANLNKKDNCGETAISKTTEPEVMRVLIQAGGGLDEINKELRKRLRGSVAPPVSSLSKDQYLSQKHRKFGKSNPEIMEIDFWNAMVASDGGAWYARSLFNDKDALKDAPVWCFERFGMSITELPDGRIIEIAGEHEDSYDPDFCIYNEVVVHHPGGNFTIYGYPEYLFPPTDFHTATLVNDHIYIIGNLGYEKRRLYGETPVFKLNTVTLEIEKVETKGEPPGWISRHKTYLKDTNIIQVSGGKLCIREDGNETYVDNKTRYQLDLNTGLWTKDT